ncbi:MAG: cation:proton antiporter, partial [Cyanobacteria bacterium HKST-UBA01]|nr:cation:proton antiporter [Cyanobacteria bacterium HKST-UBA01]
AVFALVASMSAVMAWETYTYAPVRVGGGAAFLVTDADKVSASDRADAITEQIDEILKNPELKPEDVTVAQDPEGHYCIRLGTRTLATVMDSDVKVFGTPAKSLATRWASSIKTKASRLEPIYRNKSTEKGEIKMLGEHQVLLLLLQVAILLLGAFICGEIISSMGQPAVIGQMLAGIILGKSVFGALFPDLAGIIFPVQASQANLLEVVSWIGVIFLLMLTGLETDIELIKKQGRSALGASILGIIIPYSTGFGFAYLIPDDLLLNPEHRLIVALFIGTVFSVSSVPVIAKILMDMQLLRRNVAQVILATALVHDTVGCIILALVAALASAHSFGPELFKAPVGTVVFVAVAILGRKYFFNLLRFINDRIQRDEALVTAVTVMLLLSAAFTQYVGVHVVLGAFIVGFLLSQTPIVRSRVIHSFEVITMGIFAPIFFAGAGLHVNLGLLADPKLFFLTIGMALLACASKVGANFVGGRWGGLSKWEALCLGFGANAPGAMGLIVGILGYSMGIINVELLSVIIVMSLVTTAITPPLMKWSLKHVQVGDAEQERLEKEEIKAKTHIGHLKRILLPTGGGTYGNISAHILKAISADHKIEATLFTSAKSKDAAPQHEYVDHIRGIIFDGNVTMVDRFAESEDRVEDILNESEKGYDLILVGAANTDKEENQDSLFGKHIDSLIEKSGKSLFVLHWPGERRTKPVQKILIPNSGSESSRKALELGLVIARGTGAEVTCLSVVEEPRVSKDAEESKKHAEDIARSSSSLASAYELEVQTLVREAETAGDEILKVAEEIGADAIILGGEKRPTDNLFLGQIVQKVVHGARCGVGVYIS